MDKVGKNVIYILVDFIIFFYLIIGNRVIKMFKDIIDDLLKN